MRRYLEIHMPGLGSERHELGDRAVSVGTAPQASVRVPAQAGVPASVLELTPRTDGVLLRTTDGRAVVLFDGQRQSEVLVPFGQDAYLGGVRLAFHAESKSSAKSGPILLVGMAALFASVFGALLSLEPVAASERDVEAPSLVAPAASCPTRERAAALHRARQAEATAGAKRERFVFARTEGLAALRLLGEARACYAAATEVEDAARTAADLERWTARINEDYAALRLRLRVALDHGRQAEALQAIKALQSLTRAAPSPAYAEWLSALRREVEHAVHHPGP